MKDYKLVHLSGRLLEAGNRYILAELKAHGITDVVPAYGDLFAVLFEKSPVKVTEMADRMHRTKSTVSVLVDKLEKQGYVTKAQSLEDARALNVALTPKGMALKPIFTDISTKLAQKMCAGISDEDLAVTQRTLEELFNNLSKQ